jgi:hypothetical protein
MPPVIEAAPVIRRAFHKMKSAMQDDHHARLRQAVAEIERLEAGRQRIFQEIASRFDTARFSDVVARAQERFETEKSVESEINLILMQLGANEVENRVAPMRLARMRAQMSGGVTEEWDEFSSKFPMWRDALIRERRARLEVKKEALEKTLAEVGRQLNGEFDVEDDQRVKRARREVGTLEESIIRCTTERDNERLWNSLVSRILSGT